MAVALVIIAVLGVTAVLPGLAAADPAAAFWHRANPPLGSPMHVGLNWLFLLDSQDNCLSTLSTPANAGFVVMQGFGSVAWDKNPIPTSPDLMDPTTVFRLYVDGTLMPYTQVVWVQALAIDGQNLWVAQKMDYTTFRDGMTGVHTFAGYWYLLGALAGQCEVSVVFT